MPHTFWKHQDDALEYARPLARPALFMEMRCGKSAVAIRWAKETEAKRILITCSFSSTEDWVREIGSEDVPPELVFDNVGKSPLEREANLESVALVTKYPTWSILNYESLRTQDDFYKFPWDCIIADESTYFRNPSAAITKVMVNRFASVPFKAILTGRPNPENVLDYFEQFHFLDGEFMGFHNYWAFRQVKFRSGGYSGHDWVPKPGVRDEIKTYLARRAFVLTRKQAKIGPTKLYETHVVKPNAALVRAMKSVKTDFEMSGIETNWATTQAMWLRRLAGGFNHDGTELLWDGKVKSVVSLIRHDITGQVLVWCYFRAEIEALHQAFRKAKITHAIFHGGVSKADRKLIRQQFAKGKYRVLLMQIRTGKFGLDLSAADTAIYYSNSHSLEDRIQTEDRFVHLRKDYPLLCIDMETQGSFDTDTIKALRSKDRESKQFSSNLRAFVMKQFGSAYRFAPRVRVLKPGDR